MTCVWKELIDVLKTSGIKMTPNDLLKKLKKLNTITSNMLWQLFAV